jgi:hypothetical protein
MKKPMTSKHCCPNSNQNKSYMGLKELTTMILWFFTWNVPFLFYDFFSSSKETFSLSLTLGRVITKLPLLKPLKRIATWSILILNHQIFVIVLFLFPLYQNQLFNTPSGTLSLSCRMQCFPVRYLSKISCNFVC